jgi:hypothetical protein
MFHASYRLGDTWGRQRTSFQGTYILVNRVARFFLVQTYRLLKNIPNDHKLHTPNFHKLYKRAITITKDHKIYQHFPFQGPPKFAQIWIFGLKKKHLATLHVTTKLLK